MIDSAQIIKDLATVPDQAEFGIVAHEMATGSLE
jgi:hypothetical protein